MNQADVLSRTKILYDYSNLGLPALAADFLIVMGTNDLGVARHAVQIDKKFNYPLIFVSGGVSHKVSIRNEPFGGTEAETMARILTDAGIPQSKIFLELGAKNTGDNITMTRELMASMGKSARRGHMAHTPMMQLRSLATAEKQWPQIRWSVSSDDTPFEKFIEGLDQDRFVNNLVGDVFRILDYPTKGFQKPKPMPHDVREALRELIEAGFTASLSNDPIPILG